MTYKEQKILVEILKDFLITLNEDTIFNDILDCSCNILNLSPLDCINESCKYVYTDEFQNVKYKKCIELLNNENLVLKAKQKIKDVSNNNDENDFILVDLEENNKEENNND